MKPFYVKNPNNKPPTYYHKVYGWVDHKNFANKLTYDEAQAIIKYYTETKLSLCT